MTYSKDWIFLTSLYREIHSRCNNPQDDSYHAYGGRGVQLRFKDETEWVLYIIMYLGPPRGKRKAIDRIVVNGHYERGNIRWVDDKTSHQQHNKWVSQSPSYLYEVPHTTVKGSLSPLERELSLRYQSARKMKHIKMEFRTAKEWRDYILNNVVLPSDGEFRIERIDKNKGYERGNLIAKV